MFGVLKIVSYCIRLDLKDIDLVRLGQEFFTPSKLLCQLDYVRILAE